MRSLRPVTDLVFQRTILVTIIRDNVSGHSARDLDLQLIPRSGWGVRGTLGCHLLPI